MVMLLHMAFIVFVLCGSVLTIRWPRIIWMHLPSVLWAAWIQFRGGYCPLTPLENWFREQSEQAGYETGFIEHYIGSLIYPGAIPPSTHALLGLFVLILNVAVYSWLIHKRRKTRYRELDR